MVIINNGEHKVSVDSTTWELIKSAQMHESALMTFSGQLLNERSFDGTIPAVMLKAGTGIAKWVINVPSYAGRL